MPSETPRPYGSINVRLCLIEISSAGPRRACINRVIDMGVQRLLLLVSQRFCPEIQYLSSLPSEARRGWELYAVASLSHGWQQALRYRNMYKLVYSLLAYFWK